jgi:hypothetical protein
VTPLEKVREEIRRYEQPLFEFSARERAGTVELVIAARNGGSGVHVYIAPVHERDIDHPQFSWMFQRYLYDCMHDYLVEMFIRTPQIKETR